MDDALRRLSAVEQQRDELLELLKALVRRIELNNGLGEYRGGDPFVMRRARATIALMEKNNG